MMLKLLYQLQEVEAAQLAVEQEKRNSVEYRNLRSIRAAFENKKQQYFRLENDLKQLAEQLAAFPQRIADAERKLEGERNAIYNGSVVSAKALSAREAQAAAVEERLAELKALQAAYQGEQAQKQAAHRQLKQEMEQQYAEFRRIKEHYQIQENKRQEGLTALEERKKTLTAQIDEPTMSWYEAERQRFGGSPVAMLSAEHVCSGCHTVAPPITFKRSQQKQKTFCERCGRMLFIDED